MMNNTSFTSLLILGFFLFLLTLATKGKSDDTHPKDVLVTPPKKDGSTSTTKAVLHTTSLTHSTGPTKVIPFQCEQCSANGKSDCSSSPENCPDGQDICTIAAWNEITPAKKESFVNKSCGTSSACKQGHIYIQFGQENIIRIHSICCHKDCASVSTQLPQINTTDNGRHCSACFSTSDPTKCSDSEKVNCTGNADYCIDMVTQTDPGAGKAKQETRMKGCTTKESCDTLKSARGSSFPGIEGDITTVGCHSAAIKDLPLSRSLLLALSGLLMLKGLL